MVKTKNSAGKVVAFMLVLALIVSVFAFIMPHKTAQVHAAPPTSSTGNGLYKTGGSTTSQSDLIKSWSDMVADGDVVEVSDDWSTSYIKIVNKDLEGDLYCSLKVHNWTSAFEGCTKLTKIVIEDLTYTEGALGDTSRAFYGCSSAKYISIYGDYTSFDDNSKVTDMFTGCSSLTEVAISVDYSGNKFTFKDFGLTFSSISSSSTNYTQNDNIILRGTYTLSGYVAPTPSVPSTGVVSNTVAIMLVTISVVALCYVGKKKKVVIK